MPSSSSVGTRLFTEHAFGVIGPEGPLEGQELTSVQREQSRPVQPSGQSQEAQLTGLESFSECRAPPFKQTGSPIRRAFAQAAEGMHQKISFLNA